MKRFLLLIGLALAAIACQKPVVPELTITSSTDVTVSSAGETISVQFNSNVPWIASLSSGSWATASPTSGEAGTCTVKVSVMANDSSDSRNVELTITARGEEEAKTGKVNITQLQKNSIVAPGEAISVDCNAQTISVALQSNVNYSATSNADWIKVLTTKSMTETKINLEIALNKGGSREGTVTVTGDGASANITVSQAEFVPVFEVTGVDDYGYLYVGVDGGDASFSINTNMDWNITTYDSFDWAPFSGENGSYKFSVKPNNGFDPRTAYVKFVTSDIQDPVYDDAGEPTGEYTDHVERIYVSQDGRVAEEWSVDFSWDLYDANSSYTAVLAGGAFIVSSGAGVFAYDTASGASLGQLPLTVTPRGITHDDAGNVVFFTGGDYPFDENWGLDAAAQTPLDVYVLPADKITDASAAKHIIHYANGWYGYGLDNIRVTGDATKDACIDMITAAGWAGGSSIVSWEVKNGEVALDEWGQNGYTDYVSLPWTSEIWASRNMVAKHIGNNVNSGVFTIGYDGNYNLHYNPSMSGADWQEVLTTGSSWAEGYNAMDCITWNGHKYLSFIGMTYFGKTDWGAGDGNWQYMPSYLWLVNVDDPSAPVTESCLEYYMTVDNFVYGSTTDVVLAVEGDDLCAYIVDSGVSLIKKVKYPKL